MIKIEFTEKSESVAVPANITKPELKKAFLELKEKEQGNKPRTVAESRRYYRLKKYGDSALNQGSMTKAKPTKTQTLAKINQAPNNPTQEKLQQVIDLIYDGTPLIKACEQLSISPKKFYNEMEKTQNFELKKAFYSARCLLAEWYLDRRERLEEDLKAGRIDPSTYTSLSSDYKYLAGKLAPLAYGEKIQLDAQINHSVELPSNEKLSELNKLLTDASYTIAD